MFLFLAGVLGEIVSFIGNDQDYLFDGNPKTYYWINELHVNKVMDTWPESNIRQRDWVKRISFFFKSTTSNILFMVKKKVLSNALSKYLFHGLSFI